MAVKTIIIPIGDSQGVRIPKPLLEQSGITGEVELEVYDNTIVIHAVAQTRRGWEEAFASMAGQGDDELLDPDAAVSERGSEECEWE